MSKSRAEEQAQSRGEDSIERMLVCGDSFHAALPVEAQQGVEQVERLKSFERIEVVTVDAGYEDGPISIERVYPSSPSMAPEPTTYSMRSDDGFLYYWKADEARAYVATLSAKDERRKRLKDALIARADVLMHGLMSDDILPKRVRETADDAHAAIHALAGLLSNDPAVQKAFAEAGEIEEWEQILAASPALKPEPEVESSELADVLDEIDAYLDNHSDASQRGV